MASLPIISTVLAVLVFNSTVKVGNNSFVNQMKVFLNANFEKKCGFFFIFIYRFPERNILIVGLLKNHLKEFYYIINDYSEILKYKLAYKHELIMP